MKTVFEGQVIRLQDIDYDFVEIKYGAVQYMRRCGYLIAPHSYSSNAARDQFLIVSYYKERDGDRTGMLAFDELSGFSVRENVCVLTESYAIRKPFRFREWSNENSHFIRIEPFFEGEYRISIDRGKIMKCEEGFRVLGEGMYTFQTKEIFIRFEKGALHGGETD